MKFFLAFLLMFSMPFGAFAAGSGAGSGGTPTPEPTKSTTETPVTTTKKNLNNQLEEINAMLKAKDFSKALSELVALDKEFTNNADINNLLGFASRNLSQFSQSARYYSKALQINPNHIGALEYQGELFVKTNKIKAAKKNLAKLKQLCGTNCDEYRDLKKAIAAR